MAFPDYESRKCFPEWENLRSCNVQVKKRIRFTFDTSNILWMQVEIEGDAGSNCLLGIASKVAWAHGLRWN